MQQTKLLLLLALIAFCAAQDNIVAGASDGQYIFAVTSSVPPRIIKYDLNIYRKNHYDFPDSAMTNVTFASMDSTKKRMVLWSKDAMAVVNIENSYTIEKIGYTQYPDKYYWLTDLVADAHNIYLSYAMPDCGLVVQQVAISDLTVKATYTFSSCARFTTIYPDMRPGSDPTVDKVIIISNTGNGGTFNNTHWSTKEGQAIRTTIGADQTLIINNYAYELQWLGNRTVKRYDISNGYTLANSADIHWEVTGYGSTLIPVLIEDAGAMNYFHFGYYTSVSWGRSASKGYSNSDIYYNKVATSDFTYTDTKQPIDHTGGSNRNGNLKFILAVNDVIYYVDYASVLRKIEAIALTEKPTSTVAPDTDGEGSVPKSTPASTPASTPSGVPLNGVSRTTTAPEKTRVEQSNGSSSLLLHPLVLIFTLYTFL